MPADCHLTTHVPTPEQFEDMKALLANGHAIVKAGHLCAEDTFPPNEASVAEGGDTVSFRVPLFLGGVDFGFIPIDDQERRAPRPRQLRQDQVRVYRGEGRGETTTGAFKAFL